MNEIHLTQEGRDTYIWWLKSGNGCTLALSRIYKTKFHCKMGAIKAIRKPYRIVDEVQDRRERAKDTTNLNQSGRKRRARKS